VADYIPELKKANPQYFGVSLATIDGHVYEVGDTAVPFTIQSISKPFVFALALQTLGAEKVEAVIGVEPSGDTFNSIRLRADNRPHNPMVNAGAIACSALLHKSGGNEAFACILDALSRFAGHKLSVDEAVFASERETGDRNRAIAYLLRNYAVVEGDVGLRTGREWPRRRAANEPDELAPPHSITSSARESNFGGTSRPRVFAACRLITKV
jgi:glutaminase